MYMHIYMYMHLYVDIHKDIYRYMYIHISGFVLSKMAFFPCNEGLNRVDFQRIRTGWIARRIQRPV